MANCVICGAQCGCTCSGSWRNIACSPIHYTEFLNKSKEVSGKVPYKLRASTGSVVWDIKEYTITNDDIEMITTFPNKKLTLDETEYIIVLNDEKHNILLNYNDDGKYVRVMKEDYKSLFKFSSSIHTDSQNVDEESSKNEEDSSGNNSTVYSNNHKKRR